MKRDRLSIFALVNLALGFLAGFLMRPLVSAMHQTGSVANPSPVAATPTEVRGTQYFVANIDEARQVVAGCRNGSVRGGECATPEEAIIKVDARERRKRFLGN